MQRDGILLYEPRAEMDGRADAARTRRRYCSCGGRSAEHASAAGRAPRSSACSVCPRPAAFNVLGPTSSKFPHPRRSPRAPDADKVPLAPAVECAPRGGLHIGHRMVRLITESQCRTRHTRSIKIRFLPAYVPAIFAIKMTKHACGVPPQLTVDVNAVQWPHFRNDRAESYRCGEIARPRDLTGPAVRC
jgi:hypothetical protein